MKARAMDRIAERVVKVAGGRYDWELQKVDGQGMGIEVVWKSGHTAVSITELGRVAEEMGDKAYRDIMGLPKLGIPISNSSVKPYVAMAYSEGGIIRVRIYYEMKWTLGIDIPSWQDVEEILIEAWYL